MNSLLDIADELRIYRQQGPAFARSAIEKGDGRALLSLAAAYSPEGQRVPRGLLAQAAGINAYESLTLYKVASAALARDPQSPAETIQYVEEQIEKLAPFVSETQQVAADRDAAARASHWSRFVFRPASLASLKRGQIVMPILPAECAAH